MVWRPPQLVSPGWTALPCDRLFSACAVFGMLSGFDSTDRNRSRVSDRFVRFAKRALVVAKVLQR